MNLRCMYCHTMFALGREEMLVALQNMSAENLPHYDAFCPRCRRANRIPRQRLEWANPGWQEAVKELLKEAPKTATPPQSAAAPAKPVAPPTEKIAPKAPGGKPKAISQSAKKSDASKSKSSAAATKKSTAGSAKSSAKSKTPTKSKATSKSKKK
jgi:cobalamin biosynthesis Mg chelatase CobN